MSDRFIFTTPSSGPRIYPIDPATLKKGMSWSAQDVKDMIGGIHNPGDVEFSLVSLKFAGWIEDRRPDLKARTHKQGVIILTDDQASDWTEERIVIGVRGVLKQITDQRSRVDPAGLAPAKAEVHIKRLVKNHRAEWYIRRGFAPKIQGKERPKDPRLLYLKGETDKKQ